MKENLSQGMTFDSAVNEAVDFAIKGDFLEGFFREKRMKILDDIYKHPSQMRRTFSKKVIHLKKSLDVAISRWSRLLR